MEARESLLSELEVAVRSGSQTRRLETLRRVTDLFLGTADLLNEEQIDLFDNVLGQLTSKIEATALAELSQRLAPTDCAPSEIIRRLAWHDEIKVAGPVLEQSSRLGPADLLEIAQTKSQGHLFAISGRTQVEEEVSEVLVRRGEGPVAMRLAANCGARFSQDSLLALSGRAETDPRLARELVRRGDLPAQMVRRLVSLASETALTRLLASAPDRATDIQYALSNVSASVEKEISRDYTEARMSISSMHEEGILNEAALAEFALSAMFEHVVVALAILCSVPVDVVDRLMHSEQIDALLVPCKAAGLAWATVLAMLKMKHADYSPSNQKMQHAKAEYQNLSVATAQRVLRFWQVRERTSGQTAP